MDLSTLLRRRAQQHGDREFLLFERQSTDNETALPEFRQSLGFAELDRQVDRACHFLYAQGLREGDVFNLHLPNCPAFVILWFAAARLGAVMMPTNVLSTADELAYLLNHSGCRLAFTTAEHRKTLQDCAGEVESLEKIVICDPCGENPQPDCFEAMLDEQPQSAWERTVDDTELVAIMYTSGTTSRPKGVMVTHANYIEAGRTVAGAIDLQEDDRQFVVLPLFHGNAQYYSTMSALLSGASVALMDRFSARRYFDKCIEYRCTVASLFAAPMRMILAQPVDRGHRDNCLRIVLYAQNLGEAQLQEWSDRFDAPLCQLWGMTETMGPPLMNPLHGERRNWTVGKPSGSYQVRLVDDAGRPVADGEQGEIVVRGVAGKTIMRGYYRNPGATADCIRDGWLYTGDNAVRDADGYFRFVDRKKDMIKRSGENVSAGEVENVLLQHPAVFECAVVGLPDEMRDESIVGVVVPRPGQEVTSAQLIEMCAQKLAKFRVPDEIVFRQDLPKTSVGKIQKHLLRESLMQR